MTVQIIDENGWHVARVSPGYANLALSRGEVSPTAIESVFRVTPATLVPMSAAARRRAWLKRQAKR